MVYKLTSWFRCCCLFMKVVCWFMVFNATFNNFSVISWRLVLLVEETWVPRTNNRPLASHWQTLSHNVVHLDVDEIPTHNINGGRHRLHKSNNHMSTTTTALMHEGDKHCFTRKIANFWNYTHRNIDLKFIVQVVCGLTFIKYGHNKKRGKPLLF